MRMFIIAKDGKVNPLPKYDPAAAIDKNKSIEEKRINAKLPAGDPKAHPLVMDYTYNGSASKVYGDRFWYDKSADVFNMDIDGCGVSVANDEYLTALEVNPKELLH